MAYSAQIKEQAETFIKRIAKSSLHEQAIESGRILEEQADEYLEAIKDALNDFFQDKSYTYTISDTYLHDAKLSDFIYYRISIHPRAKVSATPSNINTSPLSGNEMIRKADIFKKLISNKLTAGTNDFIIETPGFILEKAEAYKQAYQQVLKTALGLNYVYTIGDNTAPIGKDGLYHQWIVSIKPTASATVSNNNNTTVLPQHDQATEQQKVTFEKLKKHFDLINQQNGNNLWIVNEHYIETRMSLHMQVKNNSGRVSEYDLNPLIASFIEELHHARITADVGYGQLQGITNLALTPIPAYARDTKYQTPQRIMDMTSIEPQMKSQLFSVPLRINSSDYSQLFTRIFNKEKTTLDAIQKQFDKKFKDSTGNSWNIKIIPTSLSKYQITIENKNDHKNLVKMYTIFTLLKHLQINAWKFKDKKYVFNQHFVNNFSQFSTIEHYSDLEKFSNAFKETDKFKETLEGMSELFEGEHTFASGEKLLSDFYQNSQVTRENYEDELGVSWEMARELEKFPQEKIFLPHVLHISTPSDTYMFFLETCYASLGLKAANQKPKQFLDGTRGSGQDHRSNIDTKQMARIQPIFDKINFALEDLDDEKRKDVFKTSPMEEIIKTLTNLYVKKLNQKLTDFTKTFRLPAVKVQKDTITLYDSDSKYLALYRDAINTAFTLSPRLWQCLGETADINTIRTALGTLQIASQETGSLDNKKRNLTQRMTTLWTEFEKTNLFKQYAPINDSSFSKSCQHLKSTFNDNISACLENNIYYGFGRSQQGVDYFERFVYNLKIATNESFSNDKRDALVSFFISQYSGDLNYWAGCGEGLSGKMQHLVILTTPNIGMDGAIQQTKMILFERYFSLLAQEGILTTYEFGYNDRESAQFRAGILNSVSSELGLGLEYNTGIRGSESSNQDVRYGLFKRQAIAFVRANMQPFETLFISVIASILQQLAEIEDQGTSPEELMGTLGVQETIINGYMDIITIKWNYEKIKIDLPMLVMRDLVQQNKLTTDLTQKALTEPDKQTYRDFLSKLENNARTANRFALETRPTDDMLANAAGNFPLAIIPATPVQTSSAFFTSSTRAPVTFSSGSSSSSSSSSSANRTPENILRGVTTHNLTVVGAKLAIPCSSHAEADSVCRYLTTKNVQVDIHCTYDGAYFVRFTQNTICNDMRAALGEIQRALTTQPRRPWSFFGGSQ